MGRKQTVLRVSLSIILLAYLLSRLDLSAMSGIFLKFNPLFYAAGFVSLLASQAVHACLLNSLMAIHEKNGSLPRTFKTLAVGTFLGTFLPGGAGPDIMVAYNLSKASKRKEHALGAIIFARALILFSAVFLGGIFSFFEQERLPGIRNLFLAAIACIAVFMFLTMNSGVSRFSAKMFSFLKKNRITNVLYKTYFAISGYRRAKKPLVKIFLFAALTSMLRITVDYSISKSLGLEIPVRYFFIMVPLVSIASVIPVSISGIGVREGAYVGLFGAVGVEPAEAFSISILVFSTGMLFSLIGAVIYLREGVSLKAERGGQGG